MSKMGFIRDKYHDLKGRVRDRRSNRGGSGSMYRPFRGVFKKGADHDYGGSGEEKQSDGKPLPDGDGMTDSDILLKSEVFGEHDVGEYPYRVIMWKKGEKEYVTHVQVLPTDSQKPYRVWGHYFIQREAAEKDYQERVKKAKSSSSRGGSGSTDATRMKSTPEIEDIIKESILDEYHAARMYHLLGEKLYAEMGRVDAEAVDQIYNDELRHRALFGTWWYATHGTNVPIPPFPDSSFTQQSVDTLINEAIKGEVEDRQKYYDLSQQLHVVGNHSLAKDVEMIARDENLHFEYFMKLKGKSVGLGEKGSWAEKWDKALPGGAGVADIRGKEQLYIIDTDKLKDAMLSDIYEMCETRPMLDARNWTLYLDEDDIDEVEEYLYQDHGIKTVLLEIDGSLMHRATDLFGELIEWGFDEQGAIHHVEIAFGKSVADALWAEVKAEEKLIREGPGGGAGSAGSFRPR